MTIERTEGTILRSLYIFVGVLILGLMVQTTLWLVFPVADEAWWATDAGKVASGITLTPAVITYVHPGTTILYPMAALIQHGVEPKMAVRIVMATFVALSTALIALVAYRLRPQSLWWLAAALILIPDLRLLHATPPSTAASLLTVLFVHLFVYAHKGGKKNYRPLIYLGVCAGLLAATRFDTAAFLCITAAPLLVRRFRTRLMVAVVCAAVVFVLGNPHLWGQPLHYLMSIPHQILSNNVLVGPYIVGTFLITFPWAILSIILSVVSVQFLNVTSDEVGVPNALYRWLAGATVLFTALLAPLSFHPVRYFLPLYLTWDILLPLWLYALARHYLPLARLPQLTERRVEWLVIGCIVVIQCARLLILLTADTREIIL